MPVPVRVTGVVTGVEPGVVFAAPLTTSVPVLCPVAEGVKTTDIEHEPPTGVNPEQVEAVMENPPGLPLTMLLPVN